MMERVDVKTKYNLPEEVKFCKKCVMSNQRPRITFKDGVCSACNFAEYKDEVDWKQRDEELHKLCNRHRRHNGSWDAIVPSSGGKDSAYVAHQLKYRYAMNPLTVTWSPHIYTDLGFQNYQNFVHVGGFDNILGNPDGKIHRKLTRLCFEILGEPFQPFAYGQTHFPMLIAVKFGIPLIMYGENGEVEYGGDMQNAYKPIRHWSDHRKHYFSGLAPEDLKDHGIKSKDLQFYLPPSDEDLEKNKTELHFFSYYKQWIPSNNAVYAESYTGFKPSKDRSEGTYAKYASLDDKIDGFHYYLSYMKFGIGRATSDAAHEIREGKITRETGVELVHAYDGQFPLKHYQTFLDYCDITEDKFVEICNAWRGHMWGKDMDGWRLTAMVK